MGNTKVLVLCVLILCISACTPSVDDHLIAKKDMSVVIDWNSSQLSKPTCEIFKEEEVVVKDISTLSLGSSEKATIIQVSDLDGTCVGWGFPDQFRDP